MSFINNFKEGARIIYARMQTKVFWVNLAKVAVPFFLIVTIVSLLVSSSSAIFSGDFKTVVKDNFADDKWQDFFAYKIFFSFIYAFYITSMKMK
ncbi:hypothetical protein [Polaribacter sp. Asnod1-A03]|uniref:hypothetical protein n=1 Tax=Polaribacter sp. Asnod1-A03 TaxID=3160581 RepID=UPI00386FBFED